MRERGNFLLLILQEGFEPNRKKLFFMKNIPKKYFLIDFRGIMLQNIQAFIGKAEQGLK